MLGHDAARSGGTPEELRPPCTRQWYRLFPDEGLQSGIQPVIAGSRVYLGTMAGVLHALDADTGRDVWTFKAGGPILHAAALGEGRVFFGSADGRVYALEAASGKPAWSFQTGAAVWNAPAIHGGVVFIGSRDGFLYALDAATGQLRWKADTGAPLLNSPAIDARMGRVYIGSEALRVHALALADGRELWRSPQLPGASMRGYHPVIAPDGAVMVTTQPVIGYDRMQNLLLEMVKAVFGDFASWRHKKEESDRLRAENFRLMEKPETYLAQLDYLRRRLTEEPAYQTFFVLDPASGRPRFVAPIVASESMNGPGAPPLVTPEGRVIVKYQALLRSRYEHYSPFLNVGYLNTTNGHITPLMDETRTYGWHDSLLLVHDEQSQLSFAGRLLINTHQDNVNALDLLTLKGYEQPLALNIHEPAKGEALALSVAAWRGQELPAGAEWLIRGTAVYGGGSVLDVPVAIAGGRFYYLPTHELNSGCALVAYRSAPGAPPPKKTTLPAPKLSDEEWQRLQALPWDWDTLATPRLTNVLEALPGRVPGTAAAPLVAEAERTVAAIADRELDEFIWQPAFDPAAPASVPEGQTALRESLRCQVRELLSQPWQPLVIPAGKAPEEAYRFFHDPSETLLTLLLARPFLDEELQRQADARAAALLEGGLPRTYASQAGQPRVHYDVPLKLMQVLEDPVRDDLARLYPLWLWTRTPAAIGWLEKHWPQLRERLRTPPARPDDDFGNARLAGLMAYCRLARAAGDQAAVDEALPLTRQAMRARLVFALAHTRGGVIRTLPNGRSVVARWRRLTPEVARLLAAYALPVERQLMATYVDYHRPGWWLAWNVEQLWRNESPTQLPTTPMEIFAARALILGEPAERLRSMVDLPWCRADEFYVQKLALTLRAAAR
ncbi:MAG: PQQ-binding-like beta-propeller repeat protein [Verrucomicrobiae bacterium]|nr:PQQ-binding-like beta-propeller repeat protein [Verrucomicrobiae bacterium]